MGALALSLFMMFATTLMVGTEAQSIRSCDDVFKELAGKGFRVFTSTDPTDLQNNNLKTELCVDFAAFR